MVELLVVMTVISVLAAILFPVFAAAKASAIKVSCLSRFRHVSQATLLYLGDYDETFMPVNHDPGGQPDPKTDRTWVQMVLPYTGDFSTFRCPADTANLAQTEATFDQDLLPGDLFNRYYTASMHVNVGYNFQYLAPVLKVDERWTSQPKMTVALPDPAGMLMFVDSVWEVKDGVPAGGGSYLVSPPCRFEEVSGAAFDTITSASIAPNEGAHPPEIYAPKVGWEPLSDMGSSYGGAWPWHTGTASVVTVEGAAKPMTMAQLGAGCDIRPAWRGQILNRRLYLWSPE